MDSQGGEQVSRLFFIDEPPGREQAHDEFHTRGIEEGGIVPDGLPQLLQRPGFGDLNYRRVIK